MLTRVLLHVIESTRPVDPAVDLKGFQRRRKNVDDSLTVFDNILDRDSVDAPSIRWLPARSRIESRAIQENPASFPARADHLCAKRLLIRIVVVQPFRGVIQSRCLPGYWSLLRH